MSGLDPVQTFEHDHQHVTRLVIDLRTMLDRLARGERAADEIHAELVVRIEDLEEDLLLHFAREEEGLFPFVLAEVPELAGSVHDLQAAHDGVCGTLSRMAHLARRRAPDFGPHVDATFQRFEAAYAAHAQDERVFLSSLTVRLDGKQRAELRALLEGL